MFSCTIFVVQTFFI